MSAADGVIGLIAEHFARAAALGSEAGLEPEELAGLQAQALESLEAAGDAAAALYSNAEALDRYTAALEISESLDPGTRRPHRREAGRRRPPPGPRRRRRRRLGALPRLPPRRGGPRPGRRTSTARSAPALWHKGERRASIDNYQRGIDLLKDGPPCIELVRLYEEAASLYMHTGDNMLAIYASEKALRLAERLDEARAASRAHGIFGRVFGRIGDSEKARENLERSVALARESDRAEAVRALLTLGYHLEVSEADYDGAAERLPRGARDRPGGRRPALPGRAPRLARPARACTRADWDEVERATEASARLAEREGLHGKLCFPDLMRGVLSWRDGDWDEAIRYYTRAHELGEQVGRSEVAFSALFWLAAALRDSGDLAGAETELARALDICERAGLIAQSVEAISARAVGLALGGPRRAGPGSGRGGGAAGRAPALPGGPGRQGRGRRGDCATTRGRAPPRSTRPGSAGSSSAARSTRPAAECCAAGCSPSRIPTRAEAARRGGRRVRGARARPRSPRARARPVAS